jgi:hypothetical protein
MVYYSIIVYYIKLYYERHLLEATTEYLWSFMECEVVLPCPQVPAKVSYLAAFLTTTPCFLNIHFLVPPPPTSRFIKRSLSFSKFCMHFSAIHCMQLSILGRLVL